MRKKWTRRLAALLTACMLISLFPVSAFATNAEEEQNVPEIVDTVAESSQDDESGDAADSTDVRSPAEKDDGSEEPSAPDKEEKDPEDKGPAEEPPAGEEPGQDEPKAPAEDEPAQDEPEEPVTEAPKKSPAKQKASKTANGWEQDPQTVKGESSDAVCDASGGSLHLKAQTGSGNGRGTDASGWPTVFVNETVNAALAAAKSGETRYVEMTFTPATDTNQPFGVFLNYSDPGNGFVIAYDWNGGWYWQPNDSAIYPNEAWYSGSRIPGPTAGAEVTLRLEWTDTELTLAKANDQDLFGGASVELPSSGSTAFGIRCSGSAEVTISSFKCGVMSSEEPNPPAVEKPAAPVASDWSGVIWGPDVFCGNDSEYNKNHWVGYGAFECAAGEVVPNTDSDSAAYPYQCEVRSKLTAEEMLAGFNEEYPNAVHVRDMERSPQDPVATLYYNAETKGWELLTNDGRNSSLRPYGNQYFLTIWVDRYATYTWETADGTQTEKVSLCKAVQDTVADPAAYTKDGKDYTFVEWTEGTDDLGNPTYTARYDAKDVPPPVNYDGECGAVANTVFYKRTGNEVRIWGEGAMKTFGSWSDKSPWYGDESITSVVIDQGVTSVGANAFMNCKNIASATIPGSVTVIGYYAFYQTKLTSVVIPQGVTSIEHSAFADCYELSSVSLPSSLTAIGSSAFKRTALTSVVLPDNVTELKDETFWNCKQLASVKLPANLTTIGVEAFRNCTALGAVELPETVTTISKNAFYESGLTSINIPAGVTKIDEGVFHCCKNLTQIKLPEGVTEIAYLAFRETGLTSIVIPASVTAIGEQAFLYCNQLHSIVFEGNPTVHSGAFSTQSGLTRIHYYAADGVASDANAYNAILNDGTIPAGTVFQQGKLATPEKEGYIFQGWYNGETALAKDGDGYVIPEDTAKGTVFTAKWGEEQQIPEHDGECGKVEGTVFYKVTDGVLHIFGNGEMRDFEGVRSQPWNSKVNEITSVVIDEGVTSVGDRAFYEHRSITNVDLPNTLKSVGNDAFRSCSALTSVTIPDGVTSLGSRAFYYSYALTSVKLPEGLTVINESTFEQCTKLASVNIPSTVKSIGNSAFFSCSSLTSIELPDGLESIGSNAFQRCNALTELVMPDTVTSCAPYSVNSCPSMTKIVLSAGLSGQDCPRLDGCTALKTVILPAGINLPAGTFGAEKTGTNNWTCYSLQNIVAKGPLGKIDAKAFGGDFVWSWGTPLESTLIVYVTNSTDANSMKTAMGKLAGANYFIANLDGGTLAAETVAGKVAPAAKEGFVFQGWKTATGASLKLGSDGYYVFLPNSTKGAVYIAQWEAPKVYYNVTFNPGSGTLNGGATITVEEGKTIETLPTATRDGYDFKGWFIGKNEFTAYTPVTGNITVTAKWVAARPEFNSHAYVYVTVWDNNGGVVAVTTIENSDSPYITLSEVIDNDQSNPVASTYMYPWQCTLTLHADKLLTGLGYRVKGYTWNNVKDVSVTLYCTSNLAWGTWVDKVGGNNTKADIKLYVDKIVRTGDVEVSVEPVDTLTAGGPATFQVTVTNNTNMDTQYTGISVALYDKTSDSSSYFSKAYDSDGNELELSEGKQVSIGDLAAGGSFTFTLEGTIPESAAWHEVSFLGQGWDHCWNDWQYGPKKDIALTVQCGHEWTYADNGDGTHNHICATCDHVIEADLAHEFKDGSCVCGAVQTYTVTVDGAEHTVKHGDKLSTVLPEKDPTKEGYTFQGWFDGETEVTGETPITGAMTIAPKWEINKYTVTLDLAGGTVEDESTVTVEHGKPIGTLPAPTRGGYTFQGWTDADGKAVTADTIVTGEMTITAQWSRNSSGGGGSSRPDPKPPTVDIEDPDTPLAELPFVDVGADAWYKESISYVYGKKLMTGTSSMNFSPNVKLDRGTMAEVLYNLAVAAGKPDAGSIELSFPDVTEGTQNAPAIAWSATNGLVVGHDDGYFRPRDNVTREQMALMLFRYAKFIGVELKVDEDALQAFSDSESVSSWAREAMTWAASNGLLIGYGDGRIGPADSATRAQASAVIMRFHQLLEKAAGSEK